MVLVLLLVLLVLLLLGGARYTESSNLVWALVAIVLIVILVRLTSGLSLDV